MRHLLPILLSVAGVYAADAPVAVSGATPPPAPAAGGHPATVRSQPMDAEVTREYQVIINRIAAAKLERADREALIKEFDAKVEALQAKAEAAQGRAVVAQAKVQERAATAQAKAQERIAAAQAQAEAALEQAALKTPPVEHTWLGVVVLPITPALAAQLRMTPGTGLQVEEVVPDSPAALAGVQRYDVLIRLGDQMLVNQAQLDVLLATYGDGAQPTLRVLRQGEELVLTPTLKRRTVPGDRFVHTTGWALPTPAFAGMSFPPQVRALVDRLPSEVADQLTLRYVMPPSISLTDGHSEVQVDTGGRFTVRTGNGTVFSGTPDELRRFPDLPPFAVRLLQEVPPVPATPPVPAVPPVSPRTPAAPAAPPAATRDVEVSPAPGAVSPSR